MIELLEPRKLLTSTTFTNTTPVPIPDNGPQVFSDITVAGAAGVISDIDVRVNIEHPFDGDLQIFLVAPGGAVIELSTGNGGSGDNYTGTVFSKSPSVPGITGGTAPFTGKYRAEGDLSTLVGSSPNGLWRLRVQDNAGGDVGTILDWSLELTTVAKTFSNTTDFPIPDNNPTGINSPIVVSGVAGTVSNIRVGLNINHTFDRDLQIFLVSPTGTVFELSTTNGGGGDNYTDTFFQTGAGFPSITTGVAPFLRTFAPEGNIATLQGQNPNGTWNLRVIDNAGSDTGTLLDWSLSLLSAAPRANFSAVQAGNTLLITSPQPDYDESSLGFVFSAAGLMLTADDFTRVNGVTGALPLFAGVTSVTGFLGNGDDHLVLSTSGNPTLQSLTLFLSGGDNSINTTSLNLAGAALIEASAGRVALRNFGGTYHGLTVIGGQAADFVDFHNTQVIGATTLLLGGGNSQVITDGASLGSALILGSNQLSFGSSLTTYAGLTVISGAGNDRISIADGTINGAATFLLGGGRSTVGFGGAMITGAVFLESGLGGVDFTIGGSTIGSLLIIGGSTRGDNVNFNAGNTVNGAATWLLGGGRNTVTIVDGNYFNGQLFVESGAGRLDFTANSLVLNSGVILNKGLLLICGAAADTVVMHNVGITGQTTLLLGGGADSFTADRYGFQDPFTLIASGAVSVNVEAFTVDNYGSTFGTALFIVGAGSNLRFGKDGLPLADQTRFFGTLTIFGSATTTLRRRNVINNGAVTLVGVTEIP